MAAMNEIKKKIWEKERDLVTITATEKDVLLSKWWIGKTSVKTIPLEPILALSLIAFQSNINLFWNKIKGETLGLVKNHPQRLTPDVFLDLDDGLSIRGHIAEEKANKGRGEEERRLFLNVSLKDSRKAWGTTLITFTWKEFDELIESLKELAHFFTFFKSSNQHIASHNASPCRICSALDYSPLQIHIINANDTAEKDVVAVAASYVKKFMAGLTAGTSSGELRLIIRSKAPSALKNDDITALKKELPLKNEPPVLTIDESANNPWRSRLTDTAVGKRSLPQPQQPPQQLPPNLRWGDESDHTPWTGENTAKILKQFREGGKTSSLANLEPKKWSYYGQDQCGRFNYGSDGASAMSSGSTSASSSVSASYF